MKTKLQILLAGIFLATVGTGLCQPCITITTEPQAQTTCTGSPVTLSVVATGAEPLRYQWQQAFDQHNYVDRPGETNSTLVIANAQYVDSGCYRVIITNAECSVTSAVAPLTIDRPLIITAQPTNLVLSLGASVTNRVGVNFTGITTTYQWRFNGTNMPGQTKSTLSVTNLQTANEGSYDVVVANFCGSITSRVVTLTVDPTYTQITTGILVTDSVGGWNGSWVDYDGDNHLDVSIAPKGDALRNIPIYHNEGDGTFRKITTNAIAQAYVQAWTLVWADYDNDGKPDLFVPNTAGRNDMLFHNAGNGVFTRIATGHPVVDGGDATVGAWADYNLDGFLDLYVNTPCPSLYRNNGDLTFRKMTLAEVGPIAQCLLSDFVLWADVDSDRYPELYMNAVPSGGSSMTNHVYDFDSQGMSSLLNIGELRRGKEGYSSITWADYDNDGWLDALSGVERGLFAVYRNLAGQGFINVTATALPGPLTNGTFGFVVDYDNDGWQDLLVFNWDGLHIPVTWLQNNGDGTFSRQYVGSPSSLLGGTLLFGDYNNDGFLDILRVYDAGVRNSLFRHNGNANHWLKVKLDGRASNRSGIGAKVRVLSTIGGRTFWQMREISGQGGVGLDNGLIAHFGLGDATKVTTLRIEWPSGIVQEMHDVAANQFLTHVVESQGYIGVAPQFSGATRDATGAKLSFMEPAADSRYILEASTNLVDWTKLMARTSAGVATNHTDTGATNYTRRFYRLLVP